MERVTLSKSLYERMINVIATSKTGYSFAEMQSFLQEIGADMKLLAQPEPAPGGE